MSTDAGMESMTLQPLTGILLAAGKGGRFDPSGAHDKLLQRTASGDAVVVAAATALLAVLPQVIAVVREENAVAAELRTRGCRIIVCPDADADAGMGASLVCALRETMQAAGWIIALGDMPWVRAATIASLCDALIDGADIAAPVHDGKRGNPVAFGNRHLPELLKLGGDSGARSLLQAHPWRAIEVDDPGIHQDIDIPGDLA
jgi:molybdenum cofactor cytidylyltransferase